MARKRRLNEHGERLTKRETESLRSRLGSHARNNCASYARGGCPFPVCVVEIQAERIAANVCPYFVNYVLPSDPKLEQEYYDALPDKHPLKNHARKRLGIVGQDGESKTTGTGGARRCEVCSIEFVARSNRQKYCAGCAEDKRREQAKERQKKARLKRALDNR